MKSINAYLTTLLASFRKVRVLAESAISAETFSYLVFKKWTMSLYIKSAIKTTMAAAISFPIVDSVSNFTIFSPVVINIPIYFI